MLRVPEEEEKLTPWVVRSTAYASFGGLLMALSGNYRHVSGVTVGEYVYLLIRR